MSLAHHNRKLLEKAGDYVVRANVGWFAMFPGKLKTIKSEADARRGLNLILYQNNNSNPRHHYVVPMKEMERLLTQSSLSDMYTGEKRWNLTLKDNQIRVSITGESLDAFPYYGIDLPIDSNRDSYELPEEISSGETFIEGAVQRIIVNRFERDPKARNACIKHYGAVCAICHFSFAPKYGKMTEGYIHVHHIRPISEIGAESSVDPIEDLRPLCPNCHAVVHLRKPPFSIEEMRQIIGS